MRTAPLILIAVLAAASTNAANTPGALALLVNEADPSTIEAAVREALKSPDRLMRATAARMANVRSLKTLLPALRQTLEAETDVDAAVEMASATVMLGETDLPALLAVSDRFQSRLDWAISDAAARRGGMRAVDDYISVLKSRKVTSDYFLIALWGHPDLMVPASARILGLADERPWAMILEAAQRSFIAAPANVLAVSLTSKSPAIRAATIWYVVRGYHTDPSKVPPVLREAIETTEMTEEITLEEEFGRELVHRMNGVKPHEESRWIDWLGTAEAQALHRVEWRLEKLLSQRERRARFGDQPSVEMKPGRGTIESAELAKPAYIVPSLLPAGLANEIVRETRCQSQWLGLAKTVVDSSGRVQSADVTTVYTDERCRNALAALIRLSLAENTSVLSALTTDQLVVKGRGAAPCLDAPSPALVSNEEKADTLRVGGAVKAPIVMRRVEPVFPAEARRAMGSAVNVRVIAESVISRTGCVRHVRLVSQSPFGSLNAAALLALSQWKFKPGTLNGEPVDVIFNLTVSFNTGF